MWPHRQQPNRLRGPWESPGKNTGVGCHFLLQCRKVKSKSEVAQLCPTLSEPMDCSLPGSSIHGIFQARVLEWGAIAFSGKWITKRGKGNKNTIQTYSNLRAINKHREVNYSFMFNFVCFTSSYNFSWFSLWLFLKRFFWCEPLFLKSLLNLLQHCFCFMFCFLAARHVRS